jgi:hypothetical protein
MVMGHKLEFPAGYFWASICWAKPTLHLTFQWTKPLCHLLLLVIEFFSDPTQPASVMTGTGSGKRVLRWLHPCANIIAFLTKEDGYNITRGCNLVGPRSNVGVIGGIKVIMQWMGGVLYYIHKSGYCRPQFSLDSIGVWTRGLTLAR